MVKWACNACTFLNVEQHLVCDICGGAKDIGAAVLPTPLEDEDPELAEVLRISAEAANVKLPTPSEKASKAEPASYASVLAHAGKSAPLTPNYSGTAQSQPVVTKSVLVAPAEHKTVLPADVASQATTSTTVQATTTTQQSTQNSSAQVTQAAPTPQDATPVSTTPPSPATVITSPSVSTTSVPSSTSVAADVGSSTIAPNVTFTTYTPTVAATSAVTASTPATTTAAVSTPSVSVKPELVSATITTVSSPTVTMKVVKSDAPDSKVQELLPPTNLELERGLSTSSWGDDATGAEDLGDDDWADEPTVTIIDPTVALHAAASKELIRDVFELDRLQGYRAGYSLDGDLMRVHVGVSCRALGVSTEQVQVWRMDYSKMIVITVDFDRMYAASENAPNLKDIKVYQSSDTNFFQVWLNTQRQDFGLSWLLQNRLKSTFFRPPYFPVKEWPKRKALTGDDADEFQLFEERLGMGTQVQEVVEATGVDPFMALAALRYCKKDGSAAIDLLLDSKKKKAFLATLNSEDEKQSVSTQPTTTTTSATNSSSASSLMSNLFRSKKAKTEQLGEKAKVQVGAGALVELAASNFLIRMISFVTESIVTSGSNCMMCWKNLSFSGFKPTCCDSILCLYKYRDLGLGVSVLDEIKQAPEVADLLISFAFAATHEHRIEWYFPQGCIAKSSSSKGAEDLSFIDHQGKKNTALLLQVLNLMPPVSEMVRFHQDTAFKEALDARHKLLYPLLQWLIRSNRSHLRLLTKSEMCADGPDHQFLLLTSDPTREQFFRDQKRAFEKKNGKGKGSILLTHGSGIGNWHVILRTGLKTSKSSDLDEETKVGLKGTSGIAEGGAIGASGGAIWMSMQPGVSMGYTKIGNGWQQSLFGSSIGCMAICEVINDPSKRVLTGSVPGGSHVEGPHEYVCTDVRTIATRYFWVWPSSKPPNCNTSAKLGNWDGHSAVGPGTITHLMGFPDSTKAGI